MMDLSTIKKIAQEYSSLIALVKVKLKELEKIDTHYEAGNWIEKIIIWEDFIYVEYSYGSWGSLDIRNFEFPIEYLLLEGEGLKARVIQDKQSREDAQKAEEEKRDREFIKELSQRI